MRKYDIAVIIGRFQPIHKGHIPLFHRAEEIADNIVCIVGSVDKPSTPKNPFSFEERRNLINEALEEERFSSRVIIEGVRDSFYSDQEWIRNVKNLVAPWAERIILGKQNAAKDRLEIWKNNIEADIGAGTDWDLVLQLNGDSSRIGKDIISYRKVLEESNTIKIAIIGYNKDPSSFYLRKFASWDFVDIGGQGDDRVPVDASTIRDLWLSGLLSFARSNLHLSTYGFLSTYNENDFLDLQEEYHYLEKYKESTQVGPFPVQFLTTDAVVVHGDEILLIRRGAAPGKGLWALPGGFKDNDKTFFDACIKELREETRISLPEKVLRGSKREEHIFDYPNRSLRGTTVSMAYLFVLDPTQPRPRVKGGDDAVQAWWFSLADIEHMTDQLFEDHLDIIKYMTSRL